MDKDVADACFFRARELVKRVLEHIRQKEAVFKQRERFNRYPARYPEKDAIAAVLSDEVLEETTAELLVKELGRQGSFQLALAFLNWLDEASTPLAGKLAYDAAILVCCNQFQAAEALQLLQRMKGRGLQPDLRTFNMVVAACSNAGAVDGAMEVLNEMTSSGISPNEFTTMMLLQACNFKRKGRYKEGLQAVQALEDAGGLVTQEVIDMLLLVCEAAMGKASCLDSSVQVFQELHRLKLHKSTKIYNALLRSCAQRGQWQTARSYFDQMVQDGVAADTGTFNMLIRACLVGGALDHALEIFEWMVSGHDVADPLPADIDTYNTLIKACHQAGLLEKALEIMSWVVSTGVDFDETTYEELIGTVEVAQMWDQKAVNSAGSCHLALFPEHLRPAPFDGMRLRYLEHLEELSEEAELARTKLRGPSWAATSLTRGTKRVLAPKCLMPKVTSPATPVALSRVPSFQGLELSNLIKLPVSPSDGSSPRGRRDVPDHDMAPFTGRPSITVNDTPIFDRDSMMPSPSHQTPWKSQQHALAPLRDSTDGLSPHAMQFGSGLPAFPTSPFRNSRLDSPMHSLKPLSSALNSSHSSRTQLHSITPMQSVMT